MDATDSSPDLGTSRDAAPSVVPVRFAVEDEGRRLVVEWEDGTTTTVDAATLRAGCGCAGCLDDAGQQRLAVILREPEAIRITGAHLVGGYAVGFAFAPDGHGTGIFAYERIRELSTEADQGGS